METPLTRWTPTVGELRLAPFGDSCALVSVLFSSLGMAFRFAKIEYVTKVSADTAVD